MKTFYYHKKNILSQLLEYTYKKATEEPSVAYEIGSIISVVGKSTLEMMSFFHADKKSHMTYNEKQPNHSLESIIWNTLRIPQN